MGEETRIPKKTLLELERPRLDHLLYVENSNPHGFGMDPNDALPRPVVMSSITDTEAADLTPERFVCMEGPDRPQCSHYRRQLLPSSDDKDRVVCIRLCTAIRDENGEMISVGDQEVLACELREPRDPASDAKLNEFDAEIIRRQQQRLEDEKPFDPEAELEKQ